IGFVAVGRLAAPDGKAPQEQALVGRAVQVIELRANLQILALRIEPVHVDPWQRLADLPLRRPQHVGILDVRPPPLEAVRALAPGVGVADGEDPDVAKWVEKDRAAIDDAAALAGIRPVDAVARKVQRHDPVVPARLRTRAARAYDAEHLETPLSILLLIIEPDGARISAARYDDVGTRLHIEAGLVPFDP